ncbi:MAG: DUF465 domain-containing protein [Polyangiaceae bacterium]|nr:DUF465 domain-containing protein [Polyangiaceae bacterium]MCW5792163.1 DUF465 domain-containing protein [Polyangiaceae bacterium]
MSRKQSGAVELETLEQEHRELERQLQQLERRAHLTPEEQAEAAALKRAKLLRKDAIHALRAN